VKDELKRTWARTTRLQHKEKGGEGPHTPQLDSSFLLAGSHAVRVYVGDKKLRDRAAAEYFIRWIDVLRKESEEWLWWRSQKEKDHIFAQYDEARRVYHRLADEAR